MSIDIGTARFNGWCWSWWRQPLSSRDRAVENKVRERPTGKALVMHEALLSSVYNSRLPPPPLPLNYTRAVRKPQRGTTAFSVLILFPRAIFCATYLRELARLWWASAESVGVKDEHCPCTG